MQQARRAPCICLDIWHSYTTRSIIPSQYQAKISLFIVSKRQQSVTNVICTLNGTMGRPILICPHGTALFSTKCSAMWKIRSRPRIEGLKLSSIWLSTRPTFALVLSERTNYMRHADDVCRIEGGGESTASDHSRFSTP